MARIPFRQCYPFDARPPRQDIRLQLSTTDRTQGFRRIEKAAESGFFLFVAWRLSRGNGRL